MKSQYYNHQLGRLHYLDSGSLAQDSIVFLHGFTGSSRDFLDLPHTITNNYRCLIPDLPGHGKTQVIEDEFSFSTSGQVTLLQQWLSSFQNFHLCGYSMGGRLALQFAVKNSPQLRSLTLISTTAGIKEAARLSRAGTDAQLAQKILDSDPVNFLSDWLAQPLFQRIADRGQDFVLQEISRRLPLQPSGLACSLKYFGSGVMPPVWHQLNDIKVPTLVIAGSQDQKYLELASELVALISEATLKILPTGHAPIIESPNLLWRQVEEFLNSIEGRSL